MQKIMNGNTSGSGMDEDLLPSLSRQHDCTRAMSDASVDPFMPEGVDDSEVSDNPGNADSPLIVAAELSPVTMSAYSASAETSIAEAATTPIKYPENGNFNDRLSMT
jgi:hypothetical protein